MLVGGVNDSLLGGGGNDDYYLRGKVKLVAEVTKDLVTA